MLAPEEGRRERDFPYMYPLSLVFPKLLLTKENSEEDPCVMPRQLWRDIGPY